MGRKKKIAYLKVSTMQIRISAEFREWVESLKVKAGDDGDSALLERLLIREGKRLKLPPPPPR